MNNNEKAAQHIIKDSLGWVRGVEMTLADGARRVNIANKNSAMTTEGVRVVFDHMVAQGYAVRLRGGRYRRKRASTDLVNRVWRIHSDEELGITSYLTGGMGWVHKHEEPAL